MTARKKYIYHHYYGNEEVSKETFLKTLEDAFLECDTNYDNPLMNIAYVDYDALSREYEKMKRTGCTFIYAGRHCPEKPFKIKREEVK